MVKVTLEFSTVDAAIVALGKLVGGAPARAAAAPATPSAAPHMTATEVLRRQQEGSYALMAPRGEVATAPRARRGRSDKGEKRGPYKTAATPEASPVAEVAPAAVAPDMAPTAPVTEPQASGPVVTQADAHAALEKLFNTNGIDVARELLGRYGVARLRDLGPENFAAFKVEAEKLTPAAA